MFIEPLPGESSSSFPTVSMLFTVGCESSVSTKIIFHLKLHQLQFIYLAQIKVDGLTFVEALQVNIFVDVINDPPTLNMIPLTPFCEDCTITFSLDGGPRRL